MEIRSASSSPPVERSNYTDMIYDIRDVSPPRYVTEQLSSTMTIDLSDLPYEQRVYYKQLKPTIHPRNQEYDYLIIDNDLTRTLPTFEGKPDTWEPFQMQLRLISNSYGWSDREFREQLMFALRGEAVLFASNLPNATTESTESLLQALRHRFGQCQLAETHRINLYTVKKQPKESLQQYSDKINRLMLRAYPEIQGTTIYETLAVEYLLRGLPDQKLAYEIFIKNPKNVTETVEMITWHETCQKLTYKSTENDTNKQSEKSDSVRSRTENENKNQTVINIKSEHHNEDQSPQKVINKTYDTKKEKYLRQRKCYDCRRRGHLADSCPKEVSISSQTSSSLRPTIELNREEDTSNAAVGTKSKTERYVKRRKCYNCRRRGHLAESCPEERSIPSPRRTPDEE